MTTDFGVAPFTSWLLGLRAAIRYYQKLPINNGLNACVDQVMVDHKLQIENIKSAAQCIPEKGPLLVTANHPTGILDGALLLCALFSRRNDVLIIANELLCHIPLLQDRVISLNKSEQSDADRYRALRSIRRAWKRNECVVVFPAGTVSHWQWVSLQVSDAPWTTSIQSLASVLNVVEYRATINLKNPFWFHFCAAISSKARIALLLWVFLTTRHSTPTHPVIFRNLSDLN